MRPALPGLCRPRWPCALDLCRTAHTGHRPAESRPIALDDDAPNRRLASRSFVLLTFSYTLQGYVGYIFVFWFYCTGRGPPLRLAAQRAARQPAVILSIVSIPLEVDLGRSGGRPLRPAGQRIVPMAAFTLQRAFWRVGAHTSNAWIAALAMACQPPWSCRWRVRSGQP